METEIKRKAGRPKLSLEKNLKSQLIGSTLSSDTSNVVPQGNLSFSPVTAPIGAPLDDSSRIDRPKRVPIGAQKRLSAPQRPGFVRRYFNDVDDRIERAKLAGYTPVEGNFQISERSKDPSSMGAIKRISVGRGTQAVLMEIPENWYQEDQLKKVKTNKEVMEELVRTKKEQGQYGQIKTAQKETE